MKQESCCRKKTSIGGQALIEGIMMRGPKRTVLSVRTPEGNIVTEDVAGTQLKDKYKIAGVPLIRGVVGLVESMALGYKTLMRSAELSGMTDLEDEPKKQTASPAAKPDSGAPAAQAPSVSAAPASADTETTASDQADCASVQESTASDAVQAAVGEAAVHGAADKASPEADAAAQANSVPAVSAPVQPSVTSAPAEEGKQSKTTAQPKEKDGSSGVLMGVLMTIASVLGVALAVVLFMLVPSLIFNFFNNLSGGALSNFRALLEGLMKLVIFLVYILLVSMMKEIKRVFMYHGAEHKTIFCYEEGAPLTVENVRRQSRFHPRCGTSFMFLMILVGIVIASVISIAFPVLTKNTAVWVIIKILMIPLFCGIGYELIKFCGRHDNLLTKIIAAPGLWVQRITTKEPDDSMIEVAIRSMEAVIPENEGEDNW